MQQQSDSSPEQTTHVGQFTRLWLFLAGASITGVVFAIAELPFLPNTLVDWHAWAGPVQVCTVVLFLCCVTGLAWQLYRLVNERSQTTRSARGASGMSRTGAEHRTAESQALFGLVDGVTRVVLQATRDAWREQGQLWSRTVEQMGESQIVALQTSSQRIVQQIAEVAATQHDQFQRFLAGVETLRQLNQKATAEFTARMTAHQATAKQQVELLAQLVGAEGRAEELQQTLNENLAALANAQQLDQAIHSLTAAVHLLTVRTGSASQSAHVALGNNCTAREAA